MEFYIKAQSFAAPFFSDPSSAFVKAKTPKLALEKFAKEYNHPCGLYAAAAFTSSDAMKKGQKPLRRWLSNHERGIQKATKNKSGYSYLGREPGKFEIDGKLIVVPDPKEGRIYP